LDVPTASVVFVLASRLFAGGFWGWGLEGVIFMTGVLVPICKWEANPIFSAKELDGAILSTNGPSFVGAFEVVIPFDQLHLALQAWSESSISKRHELTVHIEPRWIAPQDPIFTVKARSHTHKVALDIREFSDAFSTFGKPYWNPLRMSDHDWGAVYFDRDGNVLKTVFEDCEGV
jgi:hypothetical protein